MRIEGGRSCGDSDVMALYERLAIEDIRHAATPFVRSTRNQTPGWLCQPRSLALSGDEYRGHHRRGAPALEAVGRENLMIKVPATKAGLPAIRQLIGEGININITLLFSQQVYEEVVEAYLAGLEHLVAQGGIRKVASVASFFVSRIDVAVDKIIEERLRSRQDAGNARRWAGSAERLRSRTPSSPINVTSGYSPARAGKSSGQGRPGAAPALGQHRDEEPGLPGRSLCRGADRPRYGQHGAAGDDGCVPRSREGGRHLRRTSTGAKNTMATLARSGISIDQVTAKLIEDGVQLFADAFDQLLGAVARKRADILGDQLDGQTSKPARLGKIGRRFARSVAARRQRAPAVGWRCAAFGPGPDEAQWLGWLDIAEEQHRRIGDRRMSLAADIRQGRVRAARPARHGRIEPRTGGARRNLWRTAGHPELWCSTRPTRRRFEPSKTGSTRATLFLVSSKSGTTLEPNILKQYFFERVKSAVGAEQAGSRFIAVTDPGSKLQTGRRTGSVPPHRVRQPSIGGRYSVLSDFGMVPAALMGLDIRRLLATAQMMVRSCGPACRRPKTPASCSGDLGPSSQRPAATRSPSSLRPASPISAPGSNSCSRSRPASWARGSFRSMPNRSGPPEVYGKDRVFVYIRLTSEAGRWQDDAIAALEAPAIRSCVSPSPIDHHIGQEFFRWEICNGRRGLNPRHQSLRSARRRGQQSQDTRTHRCLREKREAASRNAVFCKRRRIQAVRRRSRMSRRSKRALTAYTCGMAQEAHFGRLGAGDYCALLAYIERKQAHEDALQEIRA